jgi:hypothetical protein
MALNLENENVGIVIFGSYTAIKEGCANGRTFKFLNGTVAGCNLDCYKVPGLASWCPFLTGTVIPLLRLTSLNLNQILGSSGVGKFIDQIKNVVYLSLFK